MDETSLLTGYKAYPPEQAKLIVVSEVAPNPLRPSGKRAEALRVNEEITWIREMNAAITYLHGGKVVKQDSLHCDYWGFMTAADGLVEAARRTMDDYSVTAESTLEIAVRVGLVDTPTLGFAKEGWGGRKLYAPIGGGVCFQGDIADDEDFFSLPWERKQFIKAVTHSVADVWKSNRSDDFNSASFESYRRMADNEVRVVGAISDMDDDILSAA